MKQYTWISDNQKWAIIEVEKHSELSSVDVIDLKTRRRHSINVEHIVPGSKLFDGTLATKAEHHLITNKGTVIPTYLKDKIIELVS
ncbi:hypothetical protein CN918_29355 [Priestia megaterium]|nr:hypothetical protein CN918_29355 [Priestia megaterium]